MSFIAWGTIPDEVLIARAPRSSPGQYSSVRHAPNMLRDKCSYGLIGSTLSVPSSRLLVPAPRRLRARTPSSFPVQFLLLHLAHTLNMFPAGGYSNSDPSININIYSSAGQTATTYKVPGPRKFLHFLVVEVQLNYVNSGLDRQLISTTDKEMVRVTRGISILFLLTLPLPRFYRSLLCSPFLVRYCRTNVHVM
jgi:hypothetical protein